LRYNETDGHLEFQEVKIRNEFGLNTKIDGEVFDQLDEAVNSLDEHSSVVSEVNEGSKFEGHFLAQELDFSSDFDAGAESKI